METSKYILGFVLIFLMILCPESLLAWDTRWQFRIEAPSSSHDSGLWAIKMKKKFEHDSMKTFKGATDSSNGYTTMRNLKGGTMRGHINKDGSGLLRDQNGNFYNVNTRW